MCLCEPCVSVLRFNTENTKNTQSYTEIHFSFLFPRKYKTIFLTIRTLKMYKKTVFKQKKCQKMQFLKNRKFWGEKIWVDFGGNCVGFLCHECHRFTRKNNRIRVNSRNSWQKKNLFFPIFADL